MTAFIKHALWMPFDKLKAARIIKPAFAYCHSRKDGSPVGGLDSRFCGNDGPWEFKSGVNRHSCITLALLANLMSSPACAIDGVQQKSTAEYVSALLGKRQNSVLKHADFSKRSEELKRLYQNSQYNLLWLGADQPRAMLTAALELLANAGDQGLNPSDYDADSLSRALKDLNAKPIDDANLLATYDTALSIALLRYAHDLYEGRVRPQELSYPSEFGNKPALDAANLIKEAKDHGSLAGLPQQLEPKIKQYQELKSSLAEFRQQPKEAPFQPLRLDKIVRPGEPYPQLDALRQRLAALGINIPSNTQVDAVYDGGVLDAVKSLQQQYGLQADGVLGKETISLLNLTQAEKIKLIELAMERLRWLPGEFNGPKIVVNIPAFQLWAFNSAEDQQPLTMRVIVGKAEQNPTPMLLEHMQYLEFKPYWNIPKSIMDKEIMPKLMEDWTFLSNQDIEIAQDISERPVEEIFDELRQGRLRARQRPGSKNPLGKVKFIFPNKEDVYLHDTPIHALFDRSRRDFSHGCVRVADAEKLAEFVLSYQSGWDQTAIHQAMQGDRTQRVKLAQPIPVLFFYTTAFVDHDKHVHFYRDIYGQDALLQKALNKDPAQPGDDGRLATEKNTAPG